MKVHPIGLFSLLLAGVLAAPLLAQENVPPPAKAFASAPEISFDSMPNFLKLPTGLYLGEGIGVATKFQGRCFRLHAKPGDVATVRIRSPKGIYLREIGKGLYGFQMAHAVRVDPQDNIWAVDEGTNMVIKFNPDGRVAMAMGGRPESVEGVPSDSAVPHRASARRALHASIGRRMWPGMRQGNIFVSDGYRQFESREV